MTTSHRFQQHVRTPTTPQAGYDMHVASIAFVRHLSPLQVHCINKFINLCMIDGKKSQSQLVLLKTLKRLAPQGDGIIVLMNAINNVKPLLEVKKVRISGRTQFIPAIVPRSRQLTLAIRWIVEAARKRRIARKKMSLDLCLALEILSASRKVGAVRQRRDELHKLAEANRALIHYRWW